MPDKTLRTLALAAAVAAPALLLAGATRAATIGANVAISSIAPCPSFCGGPGATSGFVIDGGPDQSLALANLDDPRGVGQGRAEFVGAELLPLLRSLSDAEPNASVTTNAWAYRLYSYSGPATDITLDVSLIGNAEAVNPLDASIRATVAIILGSDLTSNTSDPGTLLFEVVPGDPDLDLCGNVLDLSIPVNQGIQIQNGSVTCSVQDGDEFFVWSSLGTRATRDGLASSFDSLTAAWEDPTGISAVPEPHVAVLLLGGLALARQRARRG